MARLLVVTTVPSTLAGFLLPFAQHYRSNGWRVDAMARMVSSNPKCLEHFDHVWDIEWSRNPLDPRNILKATHTICKIVKQESYDLVHVHTPIAAFITRYALRKLRNRQNTQVIYTAHGFHFHSNGHPIKNKLFLGLEKLAGRWTDHLVVINKEDHDSAITHRIVPNDRICYMPGIGIDTKIYNPECVLDEAIEDVRNDLGLSKDTPLFIMVAGFAPEKRHADALKAFVIVLQKNHTAHMAFAGSGPTMQEMKLLADKLGISQRVHFLGSRTDIPTLLRASRAIILPSVREGLPRSIMESLSLEVPGIGYSIRGVRELLDDGCGIIVPKDDIQAFAEAMIWILEHPDQAKAIGHKGRAKMQHVYNIDNIIKAHDELYAKALKTSSSNVDSLSGGLM